jgi:hypothetical protein
MKQNKNKPTKLEQSITTKYVMPWSRRYRKLYPNHLIEVKVVRSGSFLVSQFEDGQLHTLRSGTTHKIVDTGTMNPADIMSVHGVGFIAVWYDQEKLLCIIDVVDYNEKPLDTERAKTISKHYYKLI